MDEFVHVYWISHVSFEDIQMGDFFLHYRCNSIFFIMEAIWKFKGNVTCMVERMYVVCDLPLLFIIFLVMFKIPKLQKIACAI
jgi:hypothetical protein